MSDVQTMAKTGLTTTGVETQIADVATPSPSTDTTGTRMFGTKPKGLVRKAASFSRNTKSGVTKIRRDGYSTVNGFSKQNSWWEISAQVRKRAKGMCEDHASRGFSGIKGVEVHHIRPLSNGGRTVLSNLIHLCKNCHDRRHTHLYRSRQ